MIASNIEALKIENDNRIEEIQKIAKVLGDWAELETDEGMITDDNDKISREDLEESAAIGRHRIRNANMIRTMKK